METTIFGRGADHQGKAAGAKARHIGTRPAHDLAAYAGDYENAAFGVMSIREEGGALHGRGAAWARSWRIGTMRPLNCLGSKTDCCNPRQKSRPIRTGKWHSSGAGLRGVLRLRRLHDVVNGDGRVPGSTPHSMTSRGTSRRHVFPNGILHQHDPPRLNPHAGHHSLPSPSKVNNRRQSRGLPVSGCLPPKDILVPIAEDFPKPRKSNARTSHNDGRRGLRPGGSWQCPVGKFKPALFRQRHAAGDNAGRSIKKPRVHALTAGA
jgi:hypothetical protein